MFFILSEHVFKYLLKLRNDVNHEYPDNDGGHNHDCHGIKHGRLDLALDLLFAVALETALGQQRLDFLGKINRTSLKGKQQAYG